MCEENDDDCFEVQKKSLTLHPQFQKASFDLQWNC